MAAHDSEILSLAYSPPRQKGGGGGGALLLASASSDRLVHVFRADDGYALTQTLASHNSTVSSVRFSVFGDRLVSCGGKAIALSHVHDDGAVKPYKTVTVSSGTQYDVAVEPTNKYMVSAGRDKRCSPSHPHPPPPPSTLTLHPPLTLTLLQVEHFQLRQRQAFAVFTLHPHPPPPSPPTIILTPPHPHPHPHPSSPHPHPPPHPKVLQKPARRWVIL